MAADLRETQENQGVSEIQIDKWEFRVSKQESLLRLLSRPFP